uniref:hypothetical protein n=1 Tax=Acetatifactor sp. TaxID=1872090 RepID=UPI004055FD05
MINQDERGNLFGKWQIAKDTWCITNRWSNFMYLLIGEEKALLIDTGTGEGNIRKLLLCPRSGLQIRIILSMLSIFWKMETS